ncbi:MAG: hypothetical protein ACLQGP_27160 [Isosphaeraceae bacterium]
MSFQDFNFPQVQQDLGLTVDEADLFADVAILSLREEFVAALTEGTNLALAVNTEKAKSEFIIAPLLLELRRSQRDRFGLFSGVELSVDRSRGLNGVCDFIITKSSRQFILSAPLIAIVAAKNDNLRSGLGQCIASMYAAQIFNEQSSSPVETVFGVVTTGSAWKFLRLQQAVVMLDVKEYDIDNAGKILGILTQIVQNG